MSSFLAKFVKIIVIKLVFERSLSKISDAKMRVLPQPLPHPWVSKIYVMQDVVVKALI